MFLLIDPSAHDELRLSLSTSRHSADSVVYKINSRRSKSIFASVINFIKREGVSLATLDGLGVINGAGSFTALSLAGLQFSPNRKNIFSHFSPVKRNRAKHWSSQRRKKKKV